MIRTHYDVLGVSQCATTADIRAAYKQLVLVLHPDRIASAAMHRGGASSPIALQISGTGTQKLSNFQAVQDAYAVLSNDIQRTMYDAELDCQRPTTAPDLSPDGRAMSPTTRWAGGANSSPPHARFQPAKKAAALVPDVELRRMAEQDQIVAEANAEWDRRFVLTRQGILSRRPSSQQQRRTSGTASRFPSAGMNLGYQLNPDNGRTAYPPMPQEEDVVLHSSPPLPFASSACTTTRPPTSGGGSCPLPIPSFTPKSLPSASSHPVSSNDRASVPLTLGGRQLSASSSSAGRSHHPPLRGRLGSASLLPNHPPFPSCGPVSGIGAPSFTPILSSSASPAAAPAVGDPRGEEEESKDSVLPYAPRLRRHGSGAPMAPVRKEAFVGKAMFGVSRRSLSMGALKNSDCNKNVGDAAPHGPSQQQLASERTLRIFFS